MFLYITTTGIPMELCTHYMVTNTPIWHCHEQQQTSYQLWLNDSETNIVCLKHMVHTGVILNWLHLHVLSISLYMHSNNNSMHNLLQECTMMSFSSCALVFCLLLTKFAKVKFTQNCALSLHQKSSLEEIIMLCTHPRKCYQCKAWRHSM